jgi:hypothetical protein
MNKQQWQAINIDKAVSLGDLEIECLNGDYVHFYVVKTETHLVFGGVCNVGLLQSGYMLIDDCFSLDENLQEMLADLETYYNDGKDYTNMIVCNERM